MSIGQKTSHPNINRLCACQAPQAELASFLTVVPAELQEHSNSSLLLKTEKPMGFLSPTPKTTYSSTTTAPSNTAV